MVLVVLEHLQPDLLDTGWPRFTAGGWRRLLERGAYFPDCRHLASTFSTTTITTLATGAWPAQHGIVADRWYDRSIHKTVAATDEDLLATTLAQQIAAQPGGRVTVVAPDRTRGRILAGTNSAHTYWMEDDGRFVSGGLSPDWLGGYNINHPIDKLHDSKWMAEGARADTPPLRTLRYDPASPKDFAGLYQSSPFAQSAQFDFLRELIVRERLGMEESFDFVCLASSTSALLGYETGARSALLEQMVLRLDHDLAALIDQLSHSLGDNAFNLVIAGGHGAPPAPGEIQRPRMAVNGETVAQIVERALVAGKLGHVEKYVYPFLHLDIDPSRNLESVRQVAATAALMHPAVAATYTAGGACSIHDAWEQLFRNSFHPKRSGDVMISYRPEYVEDYGPRHGISYGSLYTYDTRTALCFYGPQFRAGVYDAPVASVDLAPTLARSIGVAQPSSCMGRVLAEALAE